MKRLYIKCLRCYVYAYQNTQVICSRSIIQSHTNTHTHSNPCLCTHRYVPTPIRTNQHLQALTAARRETQSSIHSLDLSRLSQKGMIKKTPLSLSLLYLSFSLSLSRTDNISFCVSTRVRFCSFEKAFPFRYKRRRLDRRSAPISTSPSARRQGHRTRRGRFADSTSP